MFNQFDIVRLKTVENVKFLSAPAGSKISPKGEWSIVGVVGTELLLSKDSAIIKIPYNDVVKIADYNINSLKELKNGEEKEGIQGPYRRHKRN